MRTTPLAAGMALGLTLGLTGAALVELGTERGAAQRGDAAAIQSANQRASAAINGVKNQNNLFGKFVAPPGQLIGAQSGPIPQDRGVGGGFPTEVIADGAITRAKLSPDLQTAVDNVGPQGPMGPPGPPGTAESIAGIPAGGDLTGTYPDPMLGSRAVGADQLDTQVAARLVGRGRTVLQSTKSIYLLPLALPNPRVGTFQTARFFHPAVSPISAAAPRDGIYQVSASVEFEGDPDGKGQREVSIRRLPADAGRVVGTRLSIAAAAERPPGQEMVTGGTVLLEAGAGDRFQVGARQDSGGRLRASVQNLSLLYLSPSATSLVAPPQGPVVTTP